MSPQAKGGIAHRCPHGLITSIVTARDAFAVALLVEQITHYFKDGWGVTEIERDVGILTRAEIEAAIQYYLNHREEIERDCQRSRALYEAHAPTRQTLSA